MDMGDSLLLAARMITGWAFLLIGARNIGNHKAIAETIGANRFPLPQALAWIGIAMQVGFGALMISGFYPAVAAIGLFVFTVLATLMTHSFWTVSEEQRPAEIGAFLGNAIMAGGLLALAAAGI